jgi:hypothetical protein
MTDDPTRTATFYDLDGTVARITRSDAGVWIAIWNSRLGKWVDAGGLFYGKLTGLGGDPAAPVISRDQAAAMIARPPAPGVAPSSRLSALTDDDIDFRLAD